jgi:hypothetical protein
MEMVFLIRQFMERCSEQNKDLHMLFADDVVLVDKSRMEVDHKLELWR